MRTFTKLSISFLILITFQISSYSLAQELTAEDYLNRGIDNFDKGNYSEAITDFTKAIEINPDYSLAYFNRGLAYAEIDNFSQACSDWQKAYQLGYKDALELINKYCK